MLEFHSLFQQKTGTYTVRASHQKKIPAAVMQQIACSLQGNQGGSPWKRVCNDMNSLNQPTTKHSHWQLGLTSIIAKCAQTLAAEATWYWRESEVTQCDLFLPPRSMVATATLKIHKERPTFKAFLIDNYGVVLRSLCQTEKLASEWERRKREDKSNSGYSIWKAPCCWIKLQYIKSAAPWSIHNIYIK